MRTRVKASWSRGAPITNRELERALAVSGELSVRWSTWPPAAPRLTPTAINDESVELLPPPANVTLAALNKRHFIQRGIETLHTARGKVEVVQEWVIGARLDAPI